MISKDYSRVAFLARHCKCHSEFKIFGQFLHLVIARLLCIYYCTPFVRRGGQIRCLLHARIVCFPITLYASLVHHDPTNVFGRNVVRRRKYILEVSAVTGREGKGTDQRYSSADHIHSAICRHTGRRRYHIAHENGQP